MNRTQLVHRKIQTVHCQISTVNVVPIRSDQAPGNVPTPHYSKPSADPLSVNAGPTEDPTQQYDLIRPQIPPRRRRPPSSPPLPKKKKEKEKVESFGHGGRGEERTFDPPLNAAKSRISVSPPLLLPPPKTAISHGSFGGDSSAIRRFDLEVELEWCRSGGSIVVF